MFELSNADGSTETFTNFDAALRAMGEAGDELFDLESGELLEAL